MLDLYCKKHADISDETLKKIIILKKQEWKYTYKSHSDWIKKNIKRSDFHVLLFLKDKLIGYTMLRRRQMFTNKKKIFLYFDTHIITKSFRGKEIFNLKPSYILMNFIMKIIRRKKLLSLLMCKNKKKKLLYKTWMDCD